VDTNERAFVVRIARQVADASDADLASIFHELRTEKKLHFVVRELNALLSDPGHSQMASRTLRRLGLLHD